MTIDIPRFKAYVDLQYMSGPAMKQGRIEAYVFAVTLIESRPLLWTVHTIDGAVFSRLPIEALAWQNKPRHNSFDRWGSIASQGHAVQHQYLKDYRANWIGQKTRGGRYAFTIDFFQDGFAEDPEQHKAINIIFGDRGEMLALPNNELLFMDDHFTKPTKGPLPYRRNQTYYVK